MESMNWKDMEGNCRVLTYGTIPAFAWTVRGKPQQIDTDGLRTTIWTTWDLAGCCVINFWNVNINKRKNNTVISPFAPVYLGVLGSNQMTNMQAYHFIYVTLILKDKMADDGVGTLEAMFLRGRLYPITMYFTWLDVYNYHVIVQPLIPMKSQLFIQVYSCLKNDYCA